MKTLDYIHLDAVAAGKVVEALQQLLADYQVFYTIHSRIPLEH